MRTIRHLLFTASTVLGLAVSAQAAPIITPLGNYDLLPNTPGQEIPLYVTGIVPSDGPTYPLILGGVFGISLSVAISEGKVGRGFLICDWCGWGTSHINEYPKSHRHLFKGDPCHGPLRQLALAHTFQTDIVSSNA